MSADNAPLASNSGAPAPEELLRAIVDSTDDAIISKDLNGTVTSWNKSAERIFGYRADEIIGRSVRLLIPPDRQEEEEGILARLRRGERVDHFETTRMRKNGQCFEVSLTISPIKDPTGRIIGASKITRDISGLKQASRAALHLSAIVNSSDDAIISKNLNGIIQSWNAGAERIFGYTAAEIVGQPVMKLIPSDRHAEEPKILEQLGRGERVDHFETIRVRKNGEHFPVSLTISPLKDETGRVIGASKIARDITQVKRIAVERERLLESERSARVQAEQSNRMKDEFLATVSHELRTPLSAIVGWAEVLAEGGQNRADVMHGIDVIKRNANLQAQMIEDLLDLGRITSGKLVLNIEAVDLGAVIREAMNSVQHSADARRIGLKANIGEVRGTLQGDARRLQQVFWNLLANGIKFTEGGGRIIVNAEQIGSVVEVSVADNGKGISPLFMPHLFERFRQADSGITRQQGGLGIGLALVRQLIELHGGTVWARSGGIGQGATFFVRLPVAFAGDSAAAASEAGHGPDGTLADLSGIKVLTVDDDSDTSEVVQRILSGRRAEVRTAKSVAGAWDVLKTFSPDVIVSDVGMPTQDGYEFVRQIREKPFFSAIPAVALTALARTEDRTRALNAGFQTHIAKPVAAAELIAMVRSMAKLRAAGSGEPTGKR